MAHKDGTPSFRQPSVVLLLEKESLANGHWSLEKITLSSHDQ